MDDFLASRLLKKEKKESKEKKIVNKEKEKKIIEDGGLEVTKTDIKEGTKESEVFISPNQFMVDNMVQQLEQSQNKYQKLQEQYLETKKSLETFENMLPQFKKWINMLTLMLGEGQDTLHLLKMQVEEFTRLNEKEEK